MSVNPIDENATPKTTGSLEELFRHHLGDEAAVPPRPMLWDQIDNSLLIRQNEVYRKRLAATRWVAAASLLLATLAGTGWWARRNAGPGSAEMAAVHQSDISRAPRLGASRLPNQPGAAAQPAGPASRPMQAPGTIASTAASVQRSAGTGPNAAGPAATRLAMGERGIAGTQTTGAYRGFTGQSRFGRAASVATAPAQGAPGHGSLAAQAFRSSGAEGLGGEADATGAGFGRLRAAANGSGATAAASGAATEAPASLETPRAAAAAPAAVALLAPLQAALGANKTTTLPQGLAALHLADEAPAAAHRWHYGASYSASVFNPNIDFSRAGIEPKYDYNHSAGFGAQSPQLTEAAAAQYREHLRPGLSQRIALLASRHLAGHWSLRTGAEFSQATATSATALSFVGEQLPDVGQSLGSPLRATDFRYRMASIPAEVRYDNAAKRGWSVYGRLGGVVSALLGVRSDVEGSPEATRTYDIGSDGSPYRRVLGSLRGGAGAQFRTATGKLAFTAGPVAEIGLTSLNAHPAQSYFSQHHPYSFGIEAGVEFGR